MNVTLTSKPYHQYEIQGRIRAKAIDSSAGWDLDRAVLTLTETEVGRGTEVRSFSGKDDWLQSDPDYPRHESFHRIWSLHPLLQCHSIILAALSERLKLTLVAQGVSSHTCTLDTYLVSSNCPLHEHHVASPSH